MPGPSSSSLGLFALAVACGSDPLRMPGEDGGRGGGAGRVDCPAGPGFGEPAPEVEIQSVAATVVDQQSAPAEGLMVYLCGTLVCSPFARTASDGSAVVGFSEPIGPMEKPAFKYGDGRSYGRFAARLPASDGTLELGRVGTPGLPEEGQPLAAGSVVDSGGVRLTLASDAEFEISAIDYPSEDDRLFRAAELPIDLAPPELLEDSGLEAIFALGPAGTVVCPAAGLSVPNSLGAAPGTELDVLMHGVDTEEEFAPWGGWVEVGVARVSDDGERIELESGALPVLSAVGLRTRE